MTKPTKWVCAQRRLRSAWASTQSDQSSLSAWRKLGSLATHWAHCEDSEQTGRMPRLIRVFAGRTLILLVLSCRSSNIWRNQQGYLWQWANELMDIWTPGSFDDFIHWNLPCVVTIGDIFCNTSVEKHGFLGYDANLRSEPLEIQIFKVVFIHTLKDKKWKHLNLFITGFYTTRWVQIS